MTALLVNVVTQHFAILETDDLPTATLRAMTDTERIPHPVTYSNEERRSGFNAPCNADQRDRSPLSRTDVVDVCRDFIRNVCSRGTRCRFRHPVDPKSPDLDEFLALTTTTTEGSRSARSSSSTSSATAAVVTVTFCHEYQNGLCRRGSERCRFVHCSPEVERIYLQTGVLDFAVRPSSKSAVDGNSTCGSNSLKLRAVDEALSDLASDCKQDFRSRDDSPPYCRRQVHGSTSGTDRKIPICKDYLKGNCKRSALCKYRHMSLTQFEVELTAGRTIELSKYDEHGRPACSGSCRLLEAENRRLRLRISELESILRGRLSPPVRR